MSLWDEIDAILRAECGDDRALVVIARIQAVCGGQQLYVPAKPRPEGCEDQA